MVLLSWLDGTVVPASHARYDPYGNFRTLPATSVNPGLTSRGFTGHQHNNTGDYDLGLIYMNARYYLPEVGRFASADSIVPDPANPQSYNRYSYVHNSPLNYTDPTGHRPTSGCGEFEGGCTLADELDFNNTWVAPDGSYVVTDPMLSAKYPGNSLAKTAAWTTVGLFTIAAAPIALEAAAVAAAPAAPAIAGGGTAACADGDCTNEGSAIIRYAQKLQGSGNYPGTDKFSEVILKKGDLLVGAAEGQGRTAFYTSIDSLLKSGRNMETLWRGLQVYKSDEFGYRTGATVYRLTQDVTAATGRALENLGNGPGGYTQYVIKDFQNVLEPIWSILLKR